MNVYQMLADYWKGYSQEDVDSLRAKLCSEEARRLDGMIEVTPRELRALSAEVIEAAATRIEGMHGNGVYTQAWRKAARMLRSQNTNDR